MVDIFTTVRVYRAIGEPYQTDEDKEKNVWALNVYTSADDGVSFFEKPFRFQDKDLADSFTEHLNTLEDKLRETIAEYTEELERLNTMLATGLPYIEMIELDEEDSVELEDDEIVLPPTTAPRSNRVH